MVENYMININETLKTTIPQINQEYVLVDNCIYMCQNYIDVAKGYDYTLGFFAILIILLLFRCLYLKYELNGRSLFKEFVNDYVHFIEKIKGNK